MTRRYAVNDFDTTIFFNGGQIQGAPEIRDGIELWQLTTKNFYDDVERRVGSAAMNEGVVWHLTTT